MSEKKHTPGPYYVKPLVNPQGWGIYFNGERIAEVVGDGTDDEYGIARLFAAAPELLAALELAADCLMGHHFETMHARLGEQCDICAKRNESVFTVIVAAIAKARGLK